jgi:hypothetical protein
MRPRSAVIAAPGTVNRVTVLVLLPMDNFPADDRQYGTQIPYFIVRHGICVEVVTA